MAVANEEGYVLVGAVIGGILISQQICEVCTCESISHVATTVEFNNVVLIYGAPIEAKAVIKVGYYEGVSGTRRVVGAAGGDCFLRGPAQAAAKSHPQGIRQQYHWHSAGPATFG